MKKYIVTIFGILLCGSMAALEFSTADYQDSDVTFHPMLPVAGQPAKAAVRLRNTADEAQPALQVQLLDAQGQILAEAQSGTIAAHSTEEVLLDYTPGANGWQDLRVVITGDRVKHEAGLRVPVLSRNQYFPWFGGTEPCDRELRYANVVLVHKPEQAEYWNRRGAITCLGKSTVNENKSAEAYAKYLGSGIGDAQAQGIMIDEIGHYCEFEIQAMPIFQGVKLFTRENPDTFTAVWLCGALKESYCNITKNAYRLQGIDLLLLECYANYLAVEFASPRRYDYFDQRIAMARQQDVLGSTVMTLGVVGNEDKFNLTDYEIEDEVRYVKRNAPEMPGIGYFHSFGPNRELTAFADELCNKYYIAPVVQIYPEDLQFSPAVPKAGEKLTIVARVNNLGAMDAKGVVMKLFLNDQLLQSKTFDIPAAAERELFPMATLEVPAVLPEGFHRVRVEIAAPAEVTILDGMAEKTLMVR